MLSVEQMLQATGGGRGDHVVSAGVFRIRRVVSSGAQVGSAVVAGLPSVWARLMAVIGRQKPCTYFACHTVMTASATLMSTAVP